jgi:hypothetical protein
MKRTRILFTSFSTVGYFMNHNFKFPLSQIGNFSETFTVTSHKKSYIKF